MRKIVDHWIDIVVFILVFIMLGSGVNYFSSENVFDGDVFYVNNQKAPYYVILNLESKINDSLDYEIEVVYEKENLVVGSQSLECSGNCEVKIDLKKIFFDEYEVFIRTKYEKKLYEKKLTFNFNKEDSNSKLIMNSGFFVNDNNIQNFSVFGELVLNEKSEVYIETYPVRQESIKYNLSFVCDKNCNFRIPMNTNILFGEYKMAIYLPNDVISQNYFVNYGNEIKKNGTNQIKKSELDLKRELAKKDKVNIPIEVTSFPQMIELGESFNLSFKVENPYYDMHEVILSYKGDYKFKGFYIDGGFNVNDVNLKLEGNDTREVVLSLVANVESSNITVEAFGSYGILNLSLISNQNDDIEKLKLMQNIKVKNIVKDDDQKYDLSFDLEDSSLEFKKVNIDSIKRIKKFRNKSLPTDVIYVDAKDFDESKVILKKNIQVINNILTCKNFSEMICYSGWESEDLKFYQNSTHVWFFVTHFSAYIGNGTNGGYLSLVDPTPFDGFVTTDNFIIINTSYNGLNNISSFIDFNYSLVGYWNFESTTTTNVFDDSTYGNDGNFTNGAHINSTNTIRGDYGEFDGANDYVITNSDSSLLLPGSLTYSAFVKWNGVGDNYQNIYTNGGWYNALRIVNDGSGNDNKILFQLNIGGTVQYLYSNITIDTNWHNIVGVYNGSQMMIYIDGVEQGTLSASGAVTTNLMENYIGAESLWGWFFNGSIDEVQVWGRALSEQEILSNYNTNVNRLYREFRNLVLGSYNFKACGIDIDGNYNCTNSRSFQMVNSTNINSCQNLNSNTYYTLTADITNDDGDCFILAGQNITFDCNGYMIDGDNDAAGYGIRTLIANRDNILIKNCRVQEFYYGLNYQDSSTLVLYNNSFVNNTYYGVYLDDDTKVTIKNSNISSNNDDGISIDSDTYGTVFEDLLVSLNGDDGVQIDTNSGGNVFLNVYIVSNMDYGLYMYGNSPNNIFKNSNVSNNGGYGMYIYNGCYNNTIVNMNISSNGEDGVHIQEDSPNNYFENLTLFNNSGNGIELYDNVSNNIFTNLDVDNNLYTNIYIHVDAGNNIFTNLNVTNSQTYSGIYVITRSPNNYFENVNVSNNGDGGDYGIYLYEDSGNNTFYNSYITDNGADGIHVELNSPINVFENLTIINNSNAIELYNNVTDNNLTNLNIKYNRASQVYIHMDSFNNRFVNVNVTNGTVEDGIYIYDNCYNNYFKNVRSSFNGDSGSDYGVDLYDSCYNNYFEDVIFDGNYGNNVYIHVNSYNNTFINVSALNSVLGDGFNFYSSSGDNYFEDVKVTNNDDQGIYLTLNSGDNYFENIDILGSGADGVYVHDFSDNNYFKDVYINDSGDEGVDILNSKNNTFIDVNITYNFDMGVVIVTNSTNNIFYNVDVSNSGDDGFYINVNSGNNSFINVTSLNNDGYGIYLGAGSAYNYFENIDVVNAGDVSIFLYTDTYNNSFEDVNIENGLSTGMYFRQNSGNNTLKDISIINVTGSALYFYILSPNNFVEDIYINGANNGIYFYDTSPNNYIENVSMQNLGGYGVAAILMTHNNTFHNVFVNRTGADAMHFENHCGLNDLDNITILNNLYNGIEFYSNSSNNRLKNIRIENSSYTAIYCYTSDVYNSSCPYSNFTNIVVNNSPTGGGLTVTYSPNNRYENISISNCGDGWGDYGMSFYQSSNNFIKDIDIFNISFSGISFRVNSSNNTLYNILIDTINDEYGFELNNLCGDNVIENFSLYNSWDQGIYIVNSPNNYMKNIVSNNGRNAPADGFLLTGSGNLTLINATISNNADRGIYITGVSPNNYLKNIEVNNNGDDGLFVNLNSSNNTVMNIESVNNSGYGVWFNDNSGEDYLENVTVENSVETGIGFYYSPNVFMKNVISSGTTGGGADGLYVVGGIENFTVINGTFNNNYDMGLYLRSTDLNLYNIESVNNGDDGFNIGNFLRVVLINATVKYNDGFGVFLNGYNNDSVLENIYIENSTEYGLEVYDSSYNLTVKNITVYNSTGSGCYFYNNHAGSIFEDLTCVNSGVYGFYVSRGYDSVYKNIFVNNSGTNDGFVSYMSGDSTFDNIYVEGAGVYGVETDYTNSSVWNNITILNSGDSGFDSDYSYNVSISNLSSNNNGGYGINIAYSQDSNFSFFEAFNNGNTGIYLYNWNGNKVIQNWSSKNNGLYGLYLYNSNNVTIIDSDFRNNSGYNLNLYNSPNAHVYFSYLDNASKIYSNVWAQSSWWNTTGPNYALGNYWNDLSCSLAVNETFWGRIFYTCLNEDYIVNAANSRVDYGPLILEPEYINISFVPPTPVNGTSGCVDCVFINTSEEGFLERSSYLDWNNSLIGYWNFENVSGSTVYDLSSYSNDGTLVNGALVNDTSKKRGFYGEFDGNNDYVDVGDLNVVSSESFTVMAWINSNNVGGSRQPIFEEDLDSNSGFMLELNSGWGVGGTLGITFWEGFDYGAGSVTDLSSNTWYHIAATYDGSIRKIYINGVLDGSDTDSFGTSGSEELHIGYGEWNGGLFNEYFDGLIDEVQVFKRALTPQEINASYMSNYYSLYVNMTNLSAGNYTYRACNINFLGNMSCTENRFLSYINVSPSVTINMPLNGSKYLEGVGIYANISSSVNLTDVRYFLDGNNLSMVYMNYDPPLNWYSLINNLSWGIHNITFVYNSTCGEVMTYGGEFYFIANKSYVVDKKIEFLGNDLYNVSLNVSNSLFDYTLRLYDFVPENFSFFNFSVMYDDNYSFSGLSYSGRYLVWERNMTQGECFNVSYLLKGNMSYSLEKAYMVGLE